MSGTWNDPGSDPLADIERLLSDMLATSCGETRPNTIVMGRRTWYRIATFGMTKRQRRRWRGRLKGDLKRARLDAAV